MVGLKKFQNKDITGLSYGTQKVAVLTRRSEGWLPLYFGLILLAAKEIIFVLVVVFHWYIWNI